MWTDIKRYIKCCRNYAQGERTGLCTTEICRKDLPLLLTGHRGEKQESNLHLRFPTEQLGIKKAMLSTKIGKKSKFEWKVDFRYLQYEAPIRQLQGRLIVISLLYEELRIISWLGV